TQNRQEAVEQVAQDVDLILVVGSQNSSNSNRLVEVAQRRGVKAELIDSASDIDPAWLEGVKSVGLTAGASAPEVLVEQVSQRLSERGCLSARHRKGSRCVASRGPCRKTQEYRLRSRGFGRLCAPIVCR